MQQSLVQMHQHDRTIHARNLRLTIAEFDRLLSSANHAYEILKDLGPFYGKEGLKEPTFRITAEPVQLPQKASEILTQLGNDLLYLGQALPKLPVSYKKQAGEELDYKLPPTWRVDAILDKWGNIKMNEIEGVDSASALMVAEQLAYNLKTLDQSTASYLIPTIKKLCKIEIEANCKIALIRMNVYTNPHTPNALRFIEMLESLSSNTLKIDLFDEQKIRTGKIRPLWENYHGIINETLLSCKGLQNLGISKEKLISNGNYNALGNKGIFALLFDNKLKSFWGKEIGKVRLERLQKAMIPSKFIRSIKELNKARKNKKVIKVSWTKGDMVILNRSKGVAIPEGDIEQSSDERWELLKQLLKEGVKIIVQDYVKPKKIKAYLRKKGTTLEEVNWYNRICVKYVCEGDPNLENSPNVALTAIEVTLGPNIIPSGRECAFTAGKF